MERGGSVGTRVVGREKKGVRREMRGLRMEKVGSAGTRVNGGEKCGVRRDQS